MISKGDAYDTSRMYRSGSHRLKDDEPALAPPSRLEVDGMGEAANAILACGEHLARVPEMPLDQRAAVDALRQEIRTLVGGLRLLATTKAGTHRIE
jgi:hypothetical protein